MFLLDDIEIRSLPAKGRGAFALSDISAGTPIGDYLGIVIPNTEIDEPRQGLYSMTLNETLAILADPKEDGIHLINHSCEPNCAMYPVGDHTLYFARRKIFRGEELTVSYLIGPPDAECNPCTHFCACGTPSCKGSLHCSEVELNAFLAFEREELRRQDNFADRLMYEVGKKLQPLSSYPKSIKDNSIYPIFAAPNQAPQRLSGKPTLTNIRKQMRRDGRRCVVPALDAEIHAVVGKEIRAYYS